MDDHTFNIVSKILLFGIPLYIIITRLFIGKDNEDS